MGSHLFMIKLKGTLRMENPRSLIFTCCFFFLALVAAGEAFMTRNKGNCRYAITIETTCVKGAETSNHVSLRFGDTKSNDIIVHQLNHKHVRKLDPLQPQVLDDMPTKPFQACMVDQFQLTGPCVESPICYLYLKSSGKDDWRPGFAQISVLEESHAHLSSQYFYFRRYLPRHVWHGADFCDKEVTPFGIKHKRKNFVGKEAN